MNMEIVSYILYIIVMIAVTLFVTILFIQTHKEIWNEMTPEIKEWFKTTRLGMWYNNKKNGVTILTDKEYCNILKSGNIRYIEVEND